MYCEFNYQFFLNMLLMKWHTMKNFGRKTLSLQSIINKVCRLTFIFIHFVVYHYYEIVSLICNACACDDCFLSLHHQVICVELCQGIYSDIIKQ